ncbi:hypothetical protein CONLIGDRAFT_655519 [Coniochaeta ligniaria NRRL 30616]|uniref:Prolyl 4-hydroxylase alpha subunit domain-containing protein n=1 Tax=Coniochaeta ligniaria NRRL 30616 TaxID=1408157 RepID=A0A1J7JDI5_9PEZI|nr:hypothetical protein CONLIGDRAFT_655519 [Coniochaeta ligniaria NRRL 30616]
MKPYILPSRQQPPSPPSTCPPHTCTTTLISLDPLLISIQSFISPSEATSLISLGIPLLTHSPITGSGTDTLDTRVRTSTSAPLPADDAVVSCVLARARSFLGPGVLDSGRDDMGAPQMVRYTAGQRFDVHADWFARPRMAAEDGGAGRRRLYNRVATIFVVLENNSTGGGETWFPRVDGGGEGLVGGGEREGQLGQSNWRVHEDGGLAFRAVPGNALFWVNLLPNGTGDARVVHAGLPIVDGVKTGMNIWPRTFFGPDA